jgi:hypothetical protein
MKKIMMCALSLGCLAGFLTAAQGDTESTDLPKHNLPVSKAGNLVVGNCDGETSLEIPNKKEGEKLSDSEARQVSQQLMDAWTKKNPGKSWVVASEDVTADKQAKETMDDRGPQSDPNASTGNAAAAKSQQGIYSNFSKEDHKTWEIEQARQIDLGKQIFHSADKLGSKTAISCDMCHPNAANTHPETYPKYQVQLQRVALLRDMINWCIENPVKGTMFREDDPRMKALEAYIISQRRGVALSAGKH